MMLNIREATALDCAAMTQIVRTSRAYEGEYQKIIEAIEFTPEHLYREQFFVCEFDAKIAAFYSLKVKEIGIELDFMFVANQFLGRGIGRKLFQHMLQTSRDMGYDEVEIISHPPTEAFYAKMGAVKRGYCLPTGRVSWQRPHMWVKTTS